MTNLESDVLIIGGGVTGCAAAYYLARAGADVLLVERFDLNTEASGRNAGGLHGQIQYEPFVELGEEWAHAFAPSLALLQESIELWCGLPDEIGVDLEVSVCGGLLVAGNDEQLRDIERKAAIEREAGVDVEILAQSDLRRVAPYLSERMVGGLLCAVEGKANPLLAAPALAHAAAEYGARLLLRTNVRSIERTRIGFDVETEAGHIECGKIVDCAGVDSGRIAQLVGVDVPVEAHPIQACVTEIAPPLVHHLLYYAGGTLTLKQARIGSLVIGGGWPARVDEHTGSVGVELASLGPNLRLAMEVVPDVARASLLRSWAGVCPGIADHRPVIGELDGIPGFVVALFPFLGFSGGPIMGHLAAQLALGEDPGRDLRPFSPARFS